MHAASAAAQEPTTSAATGGAVRSDDLHFEGKYPDARVELVLVLGGSDRFLNVDVTVRDRERNQIFHKTERYLPEGEERTVRIDLTPPARAVGPFTVQYEVTNEAARFNFHREQRFAHANALIPLTSMQSDRLIDWYRSTFPSPDGFAYGGNYLGIPFNSRVRVQAATFDDKVFHSGGRSLRLAYQAGTATHLYSNLELPGYPVRAHVWVKGNNSGDRLVVVTRDRCELARQPWERHVNKNKAVLCALDFDDWRRFEMPVVGEGLQNDSRHEDRKALATPVYLLAFSVEAGAAKEGEATERAIWIDDLAVETQTFLNERGSLEMRADTPNAQLHTAGKIVIAIGSDAPFEQGTLLITARDRKGNDVFEMSQAVAVEAGAFAFVEIPMARIAEVNPDGPVTVNATFTAPSVALRIRKSLVLKTGKHAAVFWDFEQHARYSGTEGSPGAETAGGGAEGSKQALTLPAPTNAVNEVILHPAMPGIPTRVEMMVKGGATPVRLRPEFFDAGRIGVNRMPFNRLSTPEILVDWQDWRNVSFDAPPIPPDYDNPDKQFIFEATYPLNLVLSVASAGDIPAEIHVDRIKVHTDLDAADAVVMSPLYPDENMMMQPDTPLVLRIANFHRTGRAQTFQARLLDVHGLPVREGEETLELGPEQTIDYILVPRLERGVYDLQVTGAGMKPLRAQILAVPVAEYFGETPDTLLQDLPALEQRLGMATRRIHLDWDNLELMPGVFHFNWFHNEIAKASVDGKYQVVPILGFSADWAGPEKWTAVQQKTYERFIGNPLQLPMRLTDWSIYVREAVREYAGKVAAWEFWENPDARGAPSYVPPERYRDMFEIVRRWVDIYDPDTPLIAGGFSADNVHKYLRAIPEPHTLPFDRLSVHFNVGELSPEAADVEGLFDDLDVLLKLGETKRRMDVPQLDWAIGELVSPLQQAAYHARALLIMNARLRESYRLELVNSGMTFESYGLFYRRPYGNSPNVQGLRPQYVPKPAYFTIATTQRILERSRFSIALGIPDRDASANYAYLYEKEGGGRMAAMWRARGDARDYRVPAGWQGATVMDAFGAPLPLRETLRLGPVPLFATFPDGYAEGQIRHDLRMLAPVDGRDGPLLVLMTAEPDSARRAEYRTTGSTGTVVRSDRRLIGGEPVKHTFVTGLAEEHFTFTADKPGLHRLHRTWYCDEHETNSSLAVALNSQPGQAWDLSISETGRNLKQYGIRESSLLLREVTAGLNRIAVRHHTPGRTASWKVLPVEDGEVDLAYWDPLSAVQSKGFPLTARSARGTPLKIGEQTFETGIGALAPAYIEFPLQQQFARLDVTVGVDAAGHGRGNVIFSIFGDGRLLATSGSMSGFSPPKTLTVENLGDVARLALRVVNAEADSSEVLIDWADAKLYPKAIE